MVEISHGLMVLGTAMMPLMYLNWNYLEKRISMTFGKLYIGKFEHQTSFSCLAQVITTSAVGSSQRTQTLLCRRYFPDTYCLRSSRHHRHKRVALHSQETKDHRCPPCTRYFEQSEHISVHVDSSHVQSIDLDRLLVAALLEETQD